MAVMPEALLATELATALTRTLGEDILYGPRRISKGSIKGEACFIKPTGGPAPQAYANGNTVALRSAGLQIIIRSAKENWLTGQAFARDVRDATHFARPTGIMEYQIQEQDPTYIGQDEEGHHEWTLNVLAIFEE